MNLFNTEHKRKALALTTVVMCLVIFILFFAGMKYLDPPPENGVEVIYPPKETPKPSRETSDALSNILGAANAGGSGTAGQGDGNQPGYQGQIDGSQYANSYYGSGGGSGSGKGWGLNGRSIASQGKVPQNCNEEGRVVVQIEVDRSGRVVKATAGVKGTTNSAPCLLDAARKTAALHHWNADDNAPARQIGFIVINFKLGE